MRNNLQMTILSVGYVAAIDVGNEVASRRMQYASYLLDLREIHRDRTAIMASLQVRR